MNVNSRMEQLLNRVDEIAMDLSMRKSGTATTAQFPFRVGNSTGTDPEVRNRVNCNRNFNTSNEDFGSEAMTGNKGNYSRRFSTATEEGSHVFDAYPKFHRNHRAGAVPQRNCQVVGSTANTEIGGHLHPGGAPSNLTGSYNMGDHQTNVTGLANMRKSLGNGFGFCSQNKKRKRGSCPKVEYVLTIKPYNPLIVLCGDPMERKAPRGQRESDLIVKDLGPSGTIFGNMSFSASQILEQVSGRFVERCERLNIFPEPHLVTWQIWFCKGTGVVKLNQFDDPSAERLVTAKIFKLYCVPSIPLLPLITRVEISSSDESDDYDDTNLDYVVSPVTLPQTVRRMGGTILRQGESVRTSNGTVMFEDRRMDSQHAISEITIAERINSDISDESVYKNTNPIDSLVEIGNEDVIVDEALPLPFFNYSALDVTVDSQQDRNAAVAVNEVEIFTENEHNMNTEPIVLDLESYRDAVYEANDQSFHFIEIERNGQPVSITDTIRIFKCLDDKTMFHRPQINFRDENGIDCGGLTREFAYQSSSSWYSQQWNGIALFDGTTDKWLPSGNIKPFEAGMFELVSKSMVYFSIHVGLAFVGLHPLCTKFILEDHVSKGEICRWHISNEDIADESVEAAIVGLTHLSEGRKCDNVRQVQQTLDDFNVVGCVQEMDIAEAKESLQDLKFSYIFLSRLKALNILRNTFRNSPFWSWLKDRDYVKQKLFPLVKDYPVTVEGIVGSFSNREHYPEFTAYLTTFLVNSQAAGLKLEPFLEWLTQFPFLFNADLKFEAVDTFEAVSDSTRKDKVLIHYNSVSANTCFYRLCVPKGIDEGSFCEQLHTAVYLVPMVFDKP